MAAIVTLTIIGTAVAVSIFAMWAQGQFVGQAYPKRVVRYAAFFIVAGGIAYGCLLGVFAMDKSALLQWLKIGWIAGSAITGIVALQQVHKINSEKNISDDGKSDM